MKVENVVVSMLKEVFGLKDGGDYDSELGERGSLPPKFVDQLEMH